MSTPRHRGRGADAVAVALDLGAFILPFVSGDDGPAIEEPDMSDEDRRARLEAIWRRLTDPDGLDWTTLENIEELTAPEEPTDEERRRAIDWWKDLRSAST